MVYIVTNTFTYHDYTYLQSIEATIESIDSAAAAILHRCCYADIRINAAAALPIELRFFLHQIAALHTASPAHAIQ